MRDQERRQTFVILGVVAGALLLTAIVAGGIVAAVAWRKAPKDPGGAMVSAVAGPSQDREGEGWNHAELRQYLVGRGLSVEMRETNVGTAYGPAALFILSGGREVYVQKRASAQEAKDKIGSLTSVPGFSWGRWMFQAADAGALQELRKALGAK